MKLFLAALALLLPFAAARQDAADYAELRARAEALYTEGSYELAHRVYRDVDPEAIPEDERRWVAFRTADTRWRSAAATGQTDATVFEEAGRALEELVRDVRREADQDELWAVVQESLGDFHWARRGAANWGQALNHYRAALGYWARSAEIDRARERYLSIVWRMVRPSWFEPRWDYGSWGNVLPVDIARNAVEIAIGPEDRARAHYLLGRTLQRTGGWRAQAGIPEAYGTVLEIDDGGQRTEWYDDALFHYAQWLESGRQEQDERGRWRSAPDYPAAVAAYRRLVEELRRSETRYWPQAWQRIRDITATTVDVAVANAFFPGSEVEARLSWRNAESVQLALYALDLARDVRLADGDEGSHAWLGQVDTARLELARRWTHATEDSGEHVPGSESLRLEPAPPAGAYLLEAHAGGESARALVLVSDAMLVLKASGTRALAWFCSASDGAPIAEAEVSVWQREWDGSDWRWIRATATTGADGTALVPLEGHLRSSELFAGASLGDRQAFALGGKPWRHGRESELRVYAFTDRPAYRPGDVVSWKVVARAHDGRRYSTPAGADVEWTIVGPQGDEVGSGTATLNEFGSAWGELETTEAMALGLYHARIDTVGEEGRRVANRELFRLEEYELPEFEVSVALPEDEDGERTLFRTGDTVRADVVAEYYFGGPVADASVEVLVYQKPFWQHWKRPRPYPWYFEEESGYGRRGWGGPGQLVTRETATTDARGRASIAFDTPPGTGESYEYTIEARVVDAARREVVGQGTVRVTHQPYSVFAYTEHDLYRPGDEVEARFRAIDANDQPVEATGRVVVTRDTWLRERGEYRRAPVAEARVTTAADGEASFRFRAVEDGYYRVRWVGEPSDGPSLTAETTVWVCDEETRVLGYHHGGVQLLVDKDTFRAGEKAPVMISAPASGRHVLFSVEREELLSHEVLHLTGEVKLVTLDLTDEHVPNVFLNALMVQDGRAYLDSERVVVPPVEHFLDVELIADREQVEPGDEGALKVCVRDHDGEPVRGEVALALVDEAITAIQTDLAGDPRQHFFGELRPHRVQTNGTFHSLRHVRLVEGGDGELVSERDDRDEEELEDLRSLGYGGRQRNEVAKSAVAEMAVGDVAGAARAVPQAPSAEGAEARFRRDDGGGDGGPTPRVRTDFRKTALWAPALVTDVDGCARTTVRYPDTLTRWEGTARVQTAESQFGLARVRVRTQMPLMARLQAPRFFQVGDEVVVSGVVNNRTGGPLGVDVSLDVEGLELLGRLVDGAPVADAAPVAIESGGERRVDWRLRVREPGEARLALTAVGGEFADAMERTYPVHERGAEIFLARTGVFDADSAVVRLDLPPERRPGSTELVVQVTPSLAVTMLDALPYLVEYPYGCTEQTLSRFLPATVVAKTLADFGLSPEVAMTRVFGGIEREHVDETHPDSSRRRSLDQLDDVTRAGVQRLADFQHADGGFGWWKEGDSDLFMTGYALWGLTLAREAGVEVPSSVLERAARFLDERIVQAELRPDLQAWLLHALAVRTQATEGSATKPMARAFANLWEERGRLNAYTRALFALSAHALGRGREASILVENLVNGVKIDESPDTSVVTRGGGRSSDTVQATAHWGEDGIYWRWSEGGVEATATALRALLAVDPDHELIDPVANWLVRNRRAGSWSNTRDTALCVLALSDFLRVRGELSREAAWEVAVNGAVVDTRRLAGDELLAAPTRVRVPDEHLVDGTNEVAIRRLSRDGDPAPLYFACHATFLSLEEPIPARGHEVFVRREYYRIVPRPTLLAGPRLEKVPLEDGGRLETGERVEVVLTLEAKNHLEYVVVEDFKAAGLEAVEQRSGGPFWARELDANDVGRRFGAPRGASFETADDTSRAAPADTAIDGTGRRRWVHRELRDRKVALFLDRLPEGVWEMRYELVAQTPGRFSASPVQAEAMYVPEIRANSAEWRMSIAD